MANDIVHIIVEVVLFLGAVMWAGSLISFIYYDRKCNVEVDASLVDVRISLEGREYYDKLGNWVVDKAYYPSYRYKYGHQWYTGESKLQLGFWTTHKPREYKIGEKKKIYISASDPTMCIHSRFRTSKKMIALGVGYFAGMCFCLLVFVFFLFFFPNII